MEPVSISKNFIKVELIRSCCCNGAVCTVINNIGSPHCRTGLQEVDSQSLAAACNMLCSYIIFSQCRHCAVTDWILGDSCHKLNIMSVVGQRYSHIGLSAAVVDIKLVCLDEFFIVGGR